MNAEQMEFQRLFDRLWPINRSILGPGYRQSMDILAEGIPLERLRYPSDLQVFDWKVPQEWEVADAYIVDPQGRKRCDVRENNLHLFNYSRPIRTRMPLEELKVHLYSLPQQPNAIPYVTTYYREEWGFCLTHQEFEQLPEGEYEVVIDSRLYPGHVEVGEVVLPGQSDEEIFFSTYLCHPSMASNELSGPIVLQSLYRALSQIKNRRYTYRFVVSSETIGTLCYLSQRGDYLKQKMVAGFQLTCLGDRGPVSYKFSRDGDSLGDRAARVVVGQLPNHRFHDFDPGFGSDERQYCSPGFNLPVGSFMRTMYGTYPEYHTSLDNKDFISFEHIQDVTRTILKTCRLLELNHNYKSTAPYGEPRLGPRGLYTYDPSGSVSGTTAAIMWVLNLADGKHDVIQMAERSKKPVDDILDAVEKLLAVGLLRQ